MHQRTLTSLEHQEIIESTRSDQKKADEHFARVLESKRAIIRRVVRVNPCPSVDSGAISKNSIGSWIRTVATRKCGRGWAAFWIGCARCHCGAATGATRNHKDKRQITLKRISDKKQPLCETHNWSWAYEVYNQTKSW